MRNFLNTSLQNLNWFRSAFQRDELVLKPPFQRNPVWTDKQKSFLVDTIINGYPVPEIYIQESMDSSGNSKYIIVDGQQRLRACLQYMDDKYILDLDEETNAYNDLRFSELPSEVRKIILEYKFVVRTLPEVDESELRNIFLRLNRNVVALNQQELRQATYWGPFIKFVNSLGEDERWQFFSIFTANDIRRMLDVEFISELVVAMLYGTQNKKDKLEETYQFYEKEFAQESKIKQEFNDILGELKHFNNLFPKTRWKRKSDFYSLFLTMHHFHSYLPLAREQRIALSDKLADFAKQVDEFTSTGLIEAITEDDEQNADNPAQFSKDVIKYTRSLVRASTDSGSRKRRFEVLQTVFMDVLSSSNQPPIIILIPEGGVIE